MKSIQIELANDRNDDKRIALWLTEQADFVCLPAVVLDESRDPVVVSDALDTRLFVFKRQHTALVQEGASINQDGTTVYSTTDNTVFFVGAGIPVDGVVDALSSICSLGTESIVLVPAVGHEWDAAVDYDDKVMLQWHRYLSGDLRLEMEVLLGGHLLVFNEREGAIFAQLAAAIQIVVAEPLEEELVAVYEPDRTTSQIRAWMPDEYGTTGPTFLQNN